MSCDTWFHYNPVRVVSASLDVLIQYVAGHNVVLVTTPGFVRRGTVDRLSKLLVNHRITVWDGVKSNPDLRDLDAAKASLSMTKPDCVIGLGGGSALDAAKILAVTLANPEGPSLEQIFRNKDQTKWCKRLPLLVVPTTAGTGSEVTPFATLWDSGKRKKHSLTGDFVYPDVAILDPSLTLTLGHLESLYPALDAISHALESLWNKNRTFVSEIFATRALALAIEALPNVLKDPSSLTARQQMQDASMFAGIAISQTRTALAHSISYPLTAHFGVPHGLACSFALPRLISHFLKCQPESTFALLMQGAKNLLDGLGLDELLRGYASVDSVFALTGEMHVPGRADNFSVEMPDLAAILS